MFKLLNYVESTAVQEKEYKWLSKNCNQPGESNVAQVVVHDVEAKFLDSACPKPCSRNLTNHEMIGSCKIQEFQ